MQGHSAGGVSVKLLADHIIKKEIIKGKWTSDIISNMSICWNASGEMMSTWWGQRGVLEPPPGLLYLLCWYSSLSQLICSNTELLINAWSSDEASSWRIIYQVDPILQMGRCRERVSIYSRSFSSTWRASWTWWEPSWWPEMGLTGADNSDISSAARNKWRDKSWTPASWTDITLICTVFDLYKQNKKTGIKSWIVQTLHIHICSALRGRRESPASPCHYHISPVNSVDPRLTHPPHQRDGRRPPNGQEWNRGL